jgi:hypothetical protein
MEAVTRAVAEARAAHAKWHQQFEPWETAYVDALVAFGFESLAQAIYEAGKQRPPRNEAWISLLDGDYRGMSVPPTTNKSDPDYAALAARVAKVCAAWDAIYASLPSDRLVSSERIAYLKERALGRIDLALVQTGLTVSREREWYRLCVQW